MKQRPLLVSFCDILRFFILALLASHVEMRSKEQLRACLPEKSNIKIRRGVPRVKHQKAPICTSEGSQRHLRTTCTPLHFGEKKHKWNLKKYKSAPEEMLQLSSNTSEVQQ